MEVECVPAVFCFHEWQLCLTVRCRPLPAGHSCGGRVSLDRGTSNPKDHSAGNTCSYIVSTGQ